ncbi:MAG: hypothetical protein N4J56_007744 [Chroococcidiopsis sp. SAG 2025]|uniref:hypothetical protein n=1 Tax=Chroococcidiopsis sp. SAG 2025 TaxID=171389 RepID=UPI002936E5EE|nr:hypothetical protein [Chroococcidiopsis sp. SAG 2025]MDV2998039.1 hypothetical protein [Chroococcidiopsis sp. SAG 2025]
MMFKLTKLKSKILITWGLILVIFSSIFSANSNASPLNACQRKINTNLIFPIDEISTRAQKNMISADVGTQFQLKLSEVASINSGEVELTLLEVTEDSRCPSDLNCFEAGQIQITVKVLVDKQDLGTLNLICNASRKDLAIKQFDNYVIEFVKAEPYPKSNQKIKLSDYIITLVVSLAKR